MAFFLRNPAAYTAHRNAWSRLPGPWKLPQPPQTRQTLLLPRPRYSSSSTSSFNPLRWSLRRQIVTVSVVGTVTGALYFLQPLFSLLDIPSASQSLSLFKPGSPLADSIDEHIRTHPIAESLRADPSYTESRPHLRLPDMVREHSLTAGALAGPGLIVVPPLVFADDVRGKLVSLVFLGENLCGHVGIVHGGMLATLMDESMGRCGLAALPHQIGFTANLSVDYRKPVRAGTYIVIKAEVVKLEGRKVWVKGRIEGLGDGKKDGELLVEGEALFIEPKNAKILPKLLTVQP